MITQEGQYWVDENGNKWKIHLKYSIVSKEEAEIMSKTLVDCYDCIDCCFCTESNDLVGCGDCHNSSDLEYCQGCVDCSGLFSETNKRDSHE